MGNETLQIEHDDSCVDRRSGESKRDFLIRQIQSRMKRINLLKAEEVVEYVGKD